MDENVRAYFATVNAKNPTSLKRDLKIRENTGLLDMLPDISTGIMNNAH